MFQPYGRPRGQLSPEQLRAARALLNWSRVRLGAKASLSEMTIGEFENGIRELRPANVAAIRRALEDAGIIFTNGSPSLEGSGGPNDDACGANNNRIRQRRTKPPRGP
ncbi:helix-turn-helix transcriptional regulator [Mesorhizobium argentiipisi]|uniref:Helix-turn-helix transcriptional regulator n=1 Tax=Mesorhizobium argentiipisi TaxID=3015175 RepID=A0ABU8KBA8_9HYPH